MGSALGAALAAVVVADLYGSIRDRVTGTPDATVVTSDPGQVTVTNNDEDPLVVLVENGNPCPGFVVPADLRLPTPPPLALDRQWVYDNGGADASGTAYQVTVQGKTETAVVLLGLDVVDVAPRPSADLVYSGPTCLAAVLPSRNVTVDLDAPAVELTTAVGDPVQFPLQVSASDAEAFTVHARTQTCFCTWALELRWVSLGETGSTRLEPGAGRFITAPVPETPGPAPVDPVVVWTPPPVRATIPPELLVPGDLVRERLRPEILTPGTG